jgi:hypothetical protein
LFHFIGAVVGEIKAMPAWKIRLAVAIAIGEEFLEGVVIKREHAMHAFDGLVHFDADDGRLDGLADRAIDGGLVVEVLELLARGLHLLFGLREACIADEFIDSNIGSEADCPDEQSC